jgi:ASCH domain
MSAAMSRVALPLCLSIRQPWAWLIVHGIKTIENRPRKHSHRGPVLVHASRTLDEDAFAKLAGRFGLPGRDDLPRGGIVGQCRIVDAVTQSDDPWFSGPIGFVLAEARPVRFVPTRGALGFYAIDPADEAAARAALAA